MSLLKMSITGAILILAIIVIRALVVNHLPKKTFLILWGIALLRLLVPFQVQSPISFYTLFANESTPLLSPQFAETPIIMNVDNTIKESISHATQMPQFTWIFILWVAGVAMCAFFFMISYLLCIKKFKTATLITGNEFISNWLSEHSINRKIEIKQSDKIGAPLTYGILNPQILLPRHIECNENQQLMYILTHEWIHIKHWDAAIKLLLVLTLCIHWFNPIVWIMFILTNRDIELVCDETVVHTLGDKSKSAYAYTLINLEEEKRFTSPLYNNFNKSSIEERITAIMKTKKITLSVIVVAIILVGGLTTVFATSAKNDEKIVSLAVSSDSNNITSSQSQEKIIAQYGAFGIEFNTKGEMLFNDELVRYFYDGVETSSNTSVVRYDYLNINGIVDVMTKREIVYNSDNSMDPFGKLISISKVSQADFDARDINSFITLKNPMVYFDSENNDNVDFSSSSNNFPETSNNHMVFSEGNYNPDTKSISDILSKFENFGVTFEQTGAESGYGNIYYNGKTVKTLVDLMPNGDVLSYSSKDGGEIKIYSIYNEAGELIGVNTK